jgi:hypothetical protein
LTKLALALKGAFLGSEHVRGRESRMCLAIPGQVLELVDEEDRLAGVDVAGVRQMAAPG